MDFGGRFLPVPVAMAHYELAVEVDLGELVRPDVWHQRAIRARARVHNVNRPRGEGLPQYILLDQNKTKTPPPPMTIKYKTHPSKFKYTVCP